MAIAMNGAVQPSQLGGEGLFAVKDLIPGEPILELERPLVAALDVAFLPLACSNCFVHDADAGGADQPDDLDAMIHVKACMGCKTLYYCSKRCQAESWKRHHKHECKIFQRFADKGPLSSPMRAALQIIHMTPDEQRSPFETLTASHLKEILAQGGERGKDIQILSAGLQKISGTSKSTKTIQEYFAMMQANAFTLTTAAFDPIGMALHPLAAKTNHSCDPNAFMVFDGPQMSLRALRPISKDSEILISYIDDTLPFSRRQAELGKYYFSCSCTKCSRHPTREDMFLKEPGTLPPRWDKDIKFAPGALHKWVESQDSMKDFMGEDTASATLESIQWLAFDKLDQSRNAEPHDGSHDGKALLQINKAGLQACLQTKIWPETRQPIPLLRQEVFTLLLGPGFDGLSWSWSFLQGLRLYFVIHPVLYPETFHPGRIIHKFSLAKLALMLADPATRRADPIKGVDFGVVTIGLLTEVKDNVQHSHGKNSKFAATVKNKLEQVVVDMTRGDAKPLSGIKGKIAEQWKVLRQLAESEVVDTWMKYV